MTGIYRAPVQYAVPSNTPIRIAGSTDPPFRIINLEVEGTVWVSNNAGLKAGQGTPCHPGTSLLWITPTELFAICDGPGACNIMLTTEIEDWQPDPTAIAVATATALIESGVVMVDHPLVLFSGNLNAASGRTTGWIDISRYQSLAIQLAETAASGGTIDSCQMEFSNDNGVTVSLVRTIETFDVSPNVGSTWRAVVPASGTYVRMSSSLSGTNYSLKLTGSNRNKANIEQSLVDYNANMTPDFYYSLINPFPIGSGLLVYFGPWFGEIEVSGTCTLGGALVAGTLSMLIARRNDLTGAFNVAYRIPVQTVPGYTAPVIAWSVKIPSTGNVWRLDITNNTAFVIANMQNRIAAVSGYGAVT